MKVSPDSRIIRKAAESLRETNINLSIPQAIHQANMALEMVRDAEYRVQDEAYDN
jgi:hypothetical protein